MGATGCSMWNLKLGGYEVESRTSVLTSEELDERWKAYSSLPSGEDQLQPVAGLPGAARDRVSA
jgi:hypothetical protein